MSDESQTTTGWIIFIAALGSMLGLIGVDMSRLNSFNEAFTPAFVGTIFIHFGSVVGAFIGGKLIPSSRSQTGRVTDVKLNELNKP